MNQDFKFRQLKFEILLDIPVEISNQCQIYELSSKIKASLSCKLVSHQPIGEFKAVNLSEFT